MAVAYDIKAIPTVYGARQFRSRLEAKWASFFHEAGWQFEYEPFDLGEWSPDFLLRGETQVLVEVKPITALDFDTCKKMYRAAARAGWDGELLLVGTAPLFEMGLGPFQSPAIGWLSEDVAAAYGGEKWSDIEIGRASACIAINGRPDFMSQSLAYSGRMFGQRYKECDWPDNPDWLKRIWDRAANRVQWHKK
jgi:hypothetical protein